MHDWITKLTFVEVDILEEGTDGIFSFSSFWSLNITTDHFAYLYIFRKKSSRLRSQSALLMWTHQQRGKLFQYLLVRYCWCSSYGTDIFLSFPQDSVEDCILHDCRHAAECNMQYVRVWRDEVHENEKEAIPEPFKFQYYNTDGVEILRRNNGPKKVLAYCDCHKDE